MRIAIVVAIMAVTTISLEATQAFPDGAPWGAANPAAEQNCASCHFGDDPVRESDVLVIHGLPRWPEPGSIYELEINFEGLDTAITGFQLIALAADQPVGTFASSDSNVEIIGTSIRSTVPIRSSEDVSWSVEWRAPDEVAAPIIFYVAVSAANDDGSPFGDTIHFRSYKLAPE